MFFDTNSVSSNHNTPSFWLDLADRIIKLLALLVGSAWTWMHYRRSRTYAQKLELEVEGNVFFKDGLYLEVVTGLENLGASRHPLQVRGTSCTVWAVMNDLSEIRVFTQTVFEMDNWIEPGESIHDSKVFRIDTPAEQIVWVKMTMRVESGDREWNLTRHIRVEIVKPAGGEL